MGVCVLYMKQRVWETSESSLSDSPERVLEVYRSYGRLLFVVWSLDVLLDTGVYLPSTSPVGFSAVSYDGAAEDSWIGMHAYVPSHSRKS